MSSVVKPSIRNNSSAPLLLLHGFDSSCLEWRYTMPLLEKAGLESWAVDVLGWGFTDLETMTTCDVASKRDHLYQLWLTYIRKPVVLVGPSLGAAVAIDFATNHPDAVDRLILIDASVYAGGTKTTTKWPRMIAYAGVYILKSIPLRFYGTLLACKDLSLTRAVEQVKMGRLHCLYPWWEDATVDFMMSGGYNVRSQIKKVKQKTLIIWGEDDKVIDSKEAVRLQTELADAILHQIPNCGHLPHVEKPNAVAKLIVRYIKEQCLQEEPIR